MTDKNNVCQVKLINEKKVKAVKKKMLSDSNFTNLSETFKTLGDNTRVKILYALSKDELCVCDISAVLDMSLSAVSHQLRILRNMKLVKHRKEGKIVYYALNDDHIVQLIKMGYKHVTE
ncbi:MAG: winged helix-turn-helix transcriptional regulator [Thermoplasmata archaeon]|nr:MAG: winged helix-turn-helix transcriptional regulator [Thermoplasmata archaeon]